MVRRMRGPNSTCYCERKPATASQFRPNATNGRSSNLDVGLHHDARQCSELGSAGPVEDCEDIRSATTSSAAHDAAAKVRSSEHHSFAASSLHKQRARDARHKRRVIAKRSAKCNTALPPHSHHKLVTRAYAWRAQTHDGGVSHRDVAGHAAVLGPIGAVGDGERGCIRGAKVLPLQSKQNAATRDA
jgi:hypothetical protein